MEDIRKDPFEEYIRELPPTQKEIGQAWSAAIGLQAVDGLKPSDFLYDIAKRSIEGEITIEEAGEIIDSYYENRKKRIFSAFDPINDPINPEDLPEREVQLLILLKTKPGLTRAQMAEQLGCSDATVKRTLQALIRKGRIRRIGSNKKGEWIISSTPTSKNS